MNYIYRMCKLLIAKGRIEGMQEKLDLFYAHDRLTSEQYEELCLMLAEKIGQQTIG